MPKAILLLVLLTAVPSVAAQRAMRPDLGAPFGTEDAFPQENGVLQLQGTAEYDRSREGRDALELSPTLQWGVRPGVELRLAGR